MRNMKIWALAIVSILAFSCDNDDEDIPQQTGKWRLTNVSGGLMGVDHDFPGETITWEFNAENNTVTIVNNNTNDDVFDGPDSGNYTYGFVTSESPEICAEVMEVADMDYGCVTMSNGTMTFNNTYADGFQLTFEYIPTNQTN